jgi:heptaprenyl diphosphate synthase
MKNKSKTVAFIGMCTALALILAYVEILIQPLFPTLPGIKMGLPNIIIVFLLYRRGASSAIGVSLLRILLVSLLFGNVMALLYSLAGGVLSILVMIILKKLRFLSPVGVSVAGGVTHNVGQILMAMFLLDTVELGYYLVVLTFTGTVAGILVGLCGAILVNNLPKKLI